MTAAIDVHQLSHSYADTTVLDRLSFQVQRGDFFVIIGPNGSGKTTLLKLFAGILTPGEGRIDLLVKPIGEHTRKGLARKVSFVPQTVPVDFPFTVSEVVRMGRSPHLGMLGLEGEADLAIAEQAMVFTQVDHLSERHLVVFGPA